MRKGFAVALAAVSLGAVPTLARAEPTPISLPLQNCPGLYVLAVQGTGQSTPDAPVAADSGMLGTVLEPVVTAARDLVGRAYVPYAAAFGGAVPGGPVPYSMSVTGGLDALRQMATAVTSECPHSELALVGYSQGAHVVSIFAREIGRGRGRIPADRVAAVALIADPTRQPGAPLFPGAPARHAPAPAPGTSGTEVQRVQAFPQPALPGGGIGPDQDIVADFGALDGRVASMCLPGDLACDAPPDLPMLRMAVNIAGQADLDPADPLATLASIADALASTAAKTAVQVADHDLTGYSLGTLALSPQKPLSRRLAEMSDPRAEPKEAEARGALLKLATRALNTVVALTGAVLKPDEVAYVLAAADPLDGLRRLAEKIVTAVHRPAPDRPPFRLFTQLFDTVGQLLDEAAGTADPAIWAHYLDTGRLHGSYVLGIAGGRSATQFVTDWLTAAAHDLSGPRLAAPVPSKTAAPQNDSVTDPLPVAVDERKYVSATDIGTVTGDPVRTGARRPLETDSMTGYLAVLLCCLAVAVLSRMWAWCFAPRERFLVGTKGRWFRR
ncbi:cutinase family protein [Nocardia sp. NPDC003482]